MPKVSVILPCYNGARWVDGAIGSILAQTYKNFELLIIDDGSADASMVTIAPFICDKRIRYVYQDNIGFSGAINRGLRESSGELVGFIGQDDLWMPNKLEVQVKYFDEHKNVDLVHSNCYFIDSGGRIIRVRDIKIPSFCSRKKLIEHLFIKNFVGFETVLVKRDCFDEVGFLDERMTGFSDHDVWLRIAGSFNISGYIDLRLVKKRLHKSQLSNSARYDVLKDEFLLVKKAIDRYPFLKKAKRKRLASLYYTWGITLLQKGNTEEAKQKLLKAIRCQPWKLKATAAYIAPSLYALLLNHYQRFAQVHKELNWIED